MTKPLSIGQTVQDRATRRYPAVRDRVHPAVRIAAPRVGLRPSTLHKATPLLLTRLVAVIEAAIAIPDVGFVERHLAGLDAARAGLRVPELTPEVIQRAQQSDASEEVAESRYLSAPTLPHLRDWLRAAERQRADNLLLILALRAKVASYA